MATRLLAATANAMADAACALCNGGSIEIRTGAQPATAATAASGTLLATFTLPNPAYGAAANGVATLDADPDLEVNGVADGTAGWFRVKTSGGTTVRDGAITATGGGGQLELSSTTIQTGVPVRITAGTFTQPLA